MRVIEQLGALGSECFNDPVTGKLECSQLIVPEVRQDPSRMMLDSRNATRTCRDGSVVPIFGTCPGDLARLTVGQSQGAMTSTTTPAWAWVLLGAAAAAGVYLWRK